MKKIVQNFFFILLINIFFYSFSKANPKIEIIKNINSSETLKFDFIQSSFGNVERGICYLKRPYYLKCIYSDKKQKQIIINNKTLVILHKRYDTKYFYPASKSFFLDILDKKKFSYLIKNGELIVDENTIEVKFNSTSKGKIIFYFDNREFYLSGWKTFDANENSVIFKINNPVRNEEIDKKFFMIPEIN